MIITKKSPISGKFNTMDLPIEEWQILLWERGAHAQNAFPDLTADQREFLISGITSEEWDATFKED
jgi:hypothetical protein